MVLPVRKKTTQQPPTRSTSPGLTEEARGIRRMLRGWGLLLTKHERFGTLDNPMLLEANRIAEVLQAAYNGRQLSLSELSRVSDLSFLATLPRLEALDLAVEDQDARLKVPGARQSIPGADLPEWCEEWVVSLKSASVKGKKTPPR